METFEIHLGILQRIAFAILKIAHFFQDLLSQIFWKLVGNPLVFIAWKTCGDEKHGYKRITFKKDISWQHLFGLFLKQIMVLNGWLNGLKNQYSAYGFLLKWNPSIPLIALKNKSANCQIAWLGNEQENEKGVYPLDDMTSLGTSEVYGHFSIIAKKLVGQNPSMMSIDCVWLTGENLGEKFIVNKFSFSEKEKNQTLPDAIYFPPRIVVWFFEILISISAVVAVCGITYHVWVYLRGVEFYEAIVNYLKILWDSLT